LIEPIMSERPLSPTDTGDDWLDAALREDGREHRAGYLADNGFTARVMAMLPAPAALPAWRKPALAALWTAASVGIALALPGAYTDVAHEFLRLVVGHPVSFAQIAAGVLALGIGSWAATAYALRRD
jgi:hypothetical protein